MSEAQKSYVTCDVKKNDVTRYFSDKPYPELRDVIVYVRKQFPNPHQKVLIKTDMTFPEKDLLGQLIFIDGVNNDKLLEPRGLGAISFLPVEITAESKSKNGFGIYDSVMTFTQVYGVTNFEILVFGDDADLVAEVWEYLQSTSELPYKVVFPVSVTKQLKLFKNGIDIAPYAKRLDTAAQRNGLTTKFLRSVLAELHEQVKAGKTAIQDFEDTRSMYAKWLTLCLVQKFNLPPVYLGSYISEYVAYNISYPFEKLSLFERISFVNKLPASVGYVGTNQEFMCVYQIANKIYPLPAIAFDLSTGEVVTDDMKRFDVRHLRIQDYRKRFTGSSSYFVGTGTGLQSAGSSDAATDASLAKIFAEMTRRAGLDGVYLSVRNTLMVQHAGKPYVLYYDEPLGLVGALQSEYFGNHMMVVKEEDFHNLIDVKLVLAAQRKDNAATMAEGRSEFTEIMVRAATTLTPAIPVDVLMCSELAGLYDNELSYYDQRLRCDRNVMPIVTHADSELKRTRTVFDYISLDNVMNDKIASVALSSFGTLNANSGHVTSLPVSIDTFRGCKLL